MSLSKLKKVAEEALTNLRDMAVRYERFEKEPESGTVIRFTKRYTTGGRGYSFAALHVGPRWYLTGARNSSTTRTGGWMTFDELVEFIGDGKAWVSGDWTEIPTLNPETPVDGSEELLARAIDMLSKRGGDNVGAVAKDLLELFRSVQDDTPAPREGARFPERVYPDM